jgi:hypothetical protein
MLNFTKYMIPRNSDLFKISQPGRMVITHPFVRRRPMVAFWLDTVSAAQQHSQTFPRYQPVLDFDVMPDGQCVTSAVEAAVDPPSLLRCHRSHTDGHPLDYDQLEERQKNLEWRRKSVA